MSDDLLVKVEGVSKKFCRSLKRSLWYGVQDVTSEMFGRKGQHDELRKNEFWAVNDVSFELRRGECLGLIGPNGAGKSTLLKMLNGLVKPDTGRISMRGRIGALIELGAGFNPILTARENVYVNGSVLGFTKKEIDRKFEAIVDFAEIEEFIDTPVQNFSSGMKVRLGFAVAAQMEPDVLLIDEVLAVGDSGFRSKCYGALSKMQRDTAILFVSHQIQHVSRLATNTVVLDRGELIYLGAAPEGINCYHRLFQLEGGSRSGSGELRVVGLLLNGNEGDVSLTYGQSLNLQVTIKASSSIPSAVLNFSFLDSAENIVAECNNFVVKKPLEFFDGQQYKLEVQIPNLWLNPGVYALSCILAGEDMVEHYDWLQRVRTVEVAGGRPASAPVQFAANWLRFDRVDAL